MIGCKKIYQDIPFAHRQHLHDGHCAYVHGHNWEIHLLFGCHQTDENGFVIDFGKLKFVRHWIEQNLDHACVLNLDDPLLDYFRAAGSGVLKLYLVDNCSCEGLAQHLYEVLNPMVSDETGGRVFITGVHVVEDSKNSAWWFADDKLPQELLQ